MPTDAQINSSRRNGKKSKGPVSIAGKAHSSKNATRHGLLARTVVLEGENAARFQRLIRDLTAELQPQGAVQTALVENMAVARWRQMRIWGMEKAGLDLEIRNHQGQEALNPAGQAAQAFRTLSDQSRSLDLMNRYETRYDRQFGRSLSRLLKISKRTWQPLDS